MDGVGRAIITFVEFCIFSYHGLNCLVRVRYICPPALARQQAHSASSFVLGHYYQPSGLADRELESFAK